MGKVDRLHNRLNSFAALLWALGLVLANTLPMPAGPASLRRRTQSMSLYGQSWFNSQRRRSSPPFPIY